MDTKLMGSSGWAVYADAAEGEVSRGIARGSRELVLDVTCGGYRYDVLLKRVGASQYSGRLVRREDESTGNVDCTLYRSEDEVLLFGSWLEEGKYNHWWARLHEVKRFDGEIDLQDRNGNAVGSKSRVAARLRVKRSEKKRDALPIPSKNRVRR